MSLADLSLHTAPNFRDLGGWATGDGGHVRRGLVYRSEALLSPTQEDAAALTGCGIALVVDLRGEGERSKAPNAFWAAQGVERLELDLLGRIPEHERPWTILSDRPDVAGADAAMRAVYAAMPAAGAEAMVAIFTRIADGDLPLLVHCTAGKDRTGFTSAVLLTALGVSAADVMSDYLASSGRRTDRATEATRAMVLEHAGQALETPALEAMMGVDAVYLTTSLDIIDERYDGVRPYLVQAGLSDEIFARARDRLVG